MKAIIQQQDKATILTSEIDASKHIVVVIYDDMPIIMGHDGIGCVSHAVGGVNAEAISAGLEYIHLKNDTSIKTSVELYINRGKHVEVFPKSEWKQALQWLIDNGK